MSSGLFTGGANTYAVYFGGRRGERRDDRS
jgi:hypothetical protein